MPHTFFFDSYLFYEDASAKENLKSIAECRIILDMIMRMKAFKPTENFGFTSEAAFKRFKDKINTANTTSFNKFNISVLQEAISIDGEPGLNNLKPLEETIIAVADKLSKAYAYNSIIVSNNSSVKKWKDHYNNFYSRHKSKKTDIAILSLDQTIEYLKKRYTEDFSTAIKNMDPILRLQISDTKA